MKQNYIISSHQHQGCKRLIFNLNSSVDHFLISQLVIGSIKCWETKKLTHLSRCDQRIQTQNKLSTHHCSSSYDSSSSYHLKREFKRNNADVLDCIKHNGAKLKSVKWPRSEPLPSIILDVCNKTFHFPLSKTQVGSERGRSYHFIYLYIFVQRVIRVFPYHRTAERQRGARVFPPWCSSGDDKFEFTAARLPKEVSFVKGLTTACYRSHARVELTRKCTKKKLQPALSSLV